MARHNRKSATVVNEEWIDTVLLKKVAELEERARRCSSAVGDGEDLMYDAISVAGLLRDLFVSEPLYLRSAAQHSIEIFVPQWVMPDWPGIKPEIDLPESYKGWLPETGSAFWVNGRWYPFSIQRYLDRELPGAVINGMTFKPGEIIRLYANELGGRHLDGPVSQRGEPYARADMSLKIGHLPSLAHLLVNTVALDLYRAVQPLVNRIAASRQSSG